MSVKDKIKGADDTQRETVRIDEWDVDVEVRTMTGMQRAVMLNSIMGEDGKKVMFEKLYPQLIRSCCYDPETGELLFTEEDMEWVMLKSSAPIEQLAKKAMALSGLSDDSLADAEKNLS